MLSAIGSMSRKDSFHSTIINLTTDLGVGAAAIFGAGHDPRGADITSA